jgi:hypothetical protein
LLGGPAGPALDASVRQRRVMDTDRQRRVMKAA